MADERDDAEKTEEPTSKRLEDAHKKGEVAKSQEVNHWFMIAGGAVALGMFASEVGGELSARFVTFISEPHQISMRGDALSTTLWTLAADTLSALLLPFLTFIAAAILGNMIQHKPVFAAERLAPKLEKISLAKGFKNKFSARALLDFAKGLGKILIVGAVALLLVWPERERLPLLMTYDLAQVLPLVQTLALRMFAGVIGVMAVLAIADFMYQIYEHQKQLRMSQRDVKDEHKQTEGDPMVKARIRQIRSERARQRMMAAVPEADVVITNPTHYAVALKYDMSSMNAPVLVAKGADDVALKIREVAEEHAVPVVENPPLSRALFASVELEEEIPTEHYKAVAEVIGYVMRLRERGNWRVRGAGREAGERAAR